MEQTVKTQKFEPKITEIKLWNLHNLFLAFLVGVGLTFLVIVIMIFWNLSLINSMIIGVVIIVIYAMILFFLLDPRILKQVDTTFLQTIEKAPFIKEIFIEKPVYRDVIKEVEKPVYMHVPRKKLNIPKYDFVASSLTKVYHKHSCRLGRSIKRNHKISTNSEMELKRKGFRSCKLCMKKKKKI